MVVEDVLTTGSSAAATVKAVERAGGVVVGLGVIANGDNVTADVCGVSTLRSLVNINRDIFSEEACAAYGLCAKGIPINTEFGHGKLFLARR